MDGMEDTASFVFLTVDRERCHTFKCSTTIERIPWLEERGEEREVDGKEHQQERQ